MLAKPFENKGTKVQVYLQAAEVAFGKREVVNSVEEVGFPNAVRTTYPNNPGIERKPLTDIIFELYQRYGVDL